MPFCLRWVAVVEREAAYVGNDFVSMARKSCFSVIRDGGPFYFSVGSLEQDQLPFIVVSCRNKL